MQGSQVACEGLDHGCREPRPPALVVTRSGTWGWLTPPSRELGFSILLRGVVATLSSCCGATTLEKHRLGQRLHGANCPATSASPSRPEPRGMIGSFYTRSFPAPGFLGGAGGPYAGSALNWVGTHLDTAWPGSFQAVPFQLRASSGRSCDVTFLLQMRRVRLREHGSAPRSRVRIQTRHLELPQCWTPTAATRCAPGTLCALCPGESFSHWLYEDKEEETEGQSHKL